MSTIDIKRVYIPTKGKYMEKVKQARLIYVESIENQKGLAELPRTLRKLNRKSKEVRVENYNKNGVY